MTIATIVLMGAAITLVVTNGSIFDVLRVRGPAFSRELFSCPLCLGVWIGMAMTGWACWSRQLEMGDSWPIMAPYILGIGALTGAAALTLKRIWEAFEAMAYAADVMGRERRRRDDD